MCDMVLFSAASSLAPVADLRSSPEWIAVLSLPTLATAVTWLSVELSRRRRAAPRCAGRALLAVGAAAEARRRCWRGG